MFKKLTGSIFLVSGLLFSTITTAQEVRFLHSGSMCSLADSQHSEKCLALGGWGANNLCKKKLSLICPIVSTMASPGDGSPRNVFVDTYGAGIRVHVIWQSQDNWHWKKCPPVTSKKAGFNKLSPEICDAAFGKRYLSLKVDLPPGPNIRIYGYHPGYLIK